MCFFERTDYNCGDWKWGNMIQRCQYQHRIGETCGQKLLHDECRYVRKEPCKHCQAIDVKRRRLLKLEENIRRWTAENDKFAALLAKALRERNELIEKIKEINRERPSVQAREMGTMNGLGESRISLPSFENRGTTSGYSTPTSGPYSTSGQTSGRHMSAFQPNTSRS